MRFSGSRLPSARLPSVLLFILLGAAGASVGCSSSSSNPADVDAAPTDSGAIDAADAADVDDVPPPSDAPFDASSLPARLTIEHDHLLDPDGHRVVLRGWNWGNWGTEQPQDAADNVAQGANAVRIPLRWWGGYPATMEARDDASEGHIVPARLAELDHTIADATSKGLWVVLFVDSNCGQASATRDTAAACGTASDGTPNNFVNDSKSRDTFFETWTFLAARYAEVPYIAMYELLPEPNFGCKDGGGCPDWTLAKKFYSALVPLVHAADPRTPVLVGPNGGYEVKHLEESFMPGTTGVVYTGDLLAHASSDPASVGLLTAFRAAHDVPVFVQQVGVPKSTAGATDIVNRVLGQLHDADIGWTWWTYREPFGVGNGFAPWYGTPWHEDDAWLALITNWFR